MFLRGHLWVSYQGIFFSSFPTYKNQTFTNPDPDEPVSDASLLQDKPQPVMFAPQGRHLSGESPLPPKFRHGGHQRQVQRTGVMVHSRVQAHPNRPRSATFPAYIITITAKLSPPIFTSPARRCSLSGPCTRHRCPAPSPR